MGAAGQTTAAPLGAWVCPLCAEESSASEDSGNGTAAGRTLRSLPPPARQHHGRWPLAIWQSQNVTGSLALVCSSEWLLLAVTSSPNFMTWHLRLSAIESKVPNTPSHCTLRGNLGLPPTHTTPLMFILLCPCSCCSLPPECSSLHSSMIGSF